MLYAIDAAASTLSLSRFVEDVRVVVPTAGSGFQVERLPDGRTTLVFRVLEEGRRGDVSVAGPRTHALFKNAGGVVRAVIVQFKPGWAAALFGVAGSALRDQIVPLEDIWGHSGGDVCRALLAAPSLTEVLKRIAHALAVRTHQTFEPLRDGSLDMRSACSKATTFAWRAWRSSSVSRRGIFAAPSWRASVSGPRSTGGPFACNVPCGCRRPRMTGHASPQTRATTTKHTSLPTSGSSSDSLRAPS